MAIDPNVFYRAGAIKGDLARQAKQDRQQSFQRAVSGIASVTKMIGAKQDQYDKNMSDFNGEIPREVVPEETMMQLTRHIAQEKAVYTANAKIIRSSLSRKKKREAAEENEKIKSGLAKVYADYQGAHDIGKVQEKNIQNIDQKYGDEMERDNSLNFANQEWYKSGIKFSRDGMTIDDVREDGNGKIVTHDKRLSDFKFAKPVQGLGEDTFSKISTSMSGAGLKQGNAGMSRNEDFLRNEKNKYVKAMKSLSPEEQRQFYFNGLSGEPGTAQADIDAMKQIGMSKADYDVMMDIQDEDAPGYEDAMNKREEFEQAKKSLGFRKDFLTPKMIESQWETLTNVYDSGHQEGSRLRDEKIKGSNKRQDKIDLGRSLQDGIYANDTRVKEYISSVKNNDKIMFNGNNYYPKDGGYQMKDGDGNLSKVMSKRDMAIVIGLPTGGFSNEIDNSTKMGKLNLNAKDFNGVEINDGTYTVVDGEPYTKEEFMKKVQDGTLNEQQVVEGGKNQVQIQNLRGSN